VFTIDLLKKQGIPIKNMPGGMVLLATAFFVPAILTIIMIGNYVYSSMIFSTQKRMLKEYEDKIAQFSARLEIKQSLGEEADSIILSLRETADYIDHEMQWSPILIFLAKNIPESLTLEKLNVMTGLVTKMIPKRYDPERKVSISLPKRTLSITLSGTEQAGSDQAVHKLQQVLRASTILAPKIEDVRIVSQKAGEDNDVIFYELHCIFKIE